MIDQLRWQKESGVLFFRSFFVLLAILLLVSCFPTSPRLHPPEKIENFRGEASFYVKSPEREGRLRLGFYFELPEKIRLEIFNLLGGLESILFLDGSNAILYLPREKVFWQGESQKLMSDFIGGNIAAAELASLFSGRWTIFSPENSWQIWKNEAGQITAGMKAGLKFEIKELFPQTSIPRIVYFKAENFEVRIKLLKLRFNQRWEENIFSPSFPVGTQQLSWEEISGLWKK